MKLNASYETDINYYQRKIAEYNLEASKPPEERSINHSLTNVTQLKIELAYYQKKETIRLQKLALINACQSVYNEQQPDVQRIKKQLIKDIENAYNHLKKVDGKQMIQGESGKKLVDSLEVIEEHMKALTLYSKAF